MRVVTSIVYMRFISGSLVIWLKPLSSCGIVIATYNKHK